MPFICIITAPASPFSLPKSHHSPTGHDDFFVQMKPAFIAAPNSLCIPCQAQCSLLRLGLRGKKTREKLVTSESNLTREQLLNEAI